MQTVKSIGSLLQLLENAIHQFLIPAMSGRSPCSELERELFSLPCQLGGLNILDQCIVTFSILDIGGSVLH